MVPKQSQTSGPVEPSADEPRLKPLVPTDLAASIEHERVELMQIQAILKCLYEVLLYADDDDSVMHADVANVCARLINESVGRLDSLLMRGPDPSSGNDLGASTPSNPSGPEE